MRFLLLVAFAMLGCHSSPASEPPPTATERATFALGCYWCAQHAFDGVEGVVTVTAGHAGEGTDWREAVEVRYDPGRITYRSLLDRFWRNVDPLDAEGQFCDRGSEYRSGIFVHSEEQRRLAQASKETIERERGIEIVTEILDAAESFEPVRESEQHYYDKNPVRYKAYRLNCGRDARLHELWGEPR